MCLFRWKEAVDLLQYGTGKSKKMLRGTDPAGNDCKEKMILTNFYVYCNEDMLKYKHINVE